MAEVVIRPIEARDLPVLCRLWADVFGDPKTLVNDFFRLLPGMGSGFCAIVKENIAGCAYLLTGQTLVCPEQKRKPLAYLYAVAVDPVFRGRGIGTALSRTAFAQGEDRGLQLLCTQPADEGLFTWYEKCVETVCVLRRRQELLCAGEEQPFMELSPTEYNLWRENLLRAVPHIYLEDAALRWQHALCRSYDGGFYRIGDSIAAAYRDGDTLLVKELLCAEAGAGALQFGPEDDTASRRTAAASLAASLGAKNALLCTADPRGEPYIAARPGSLPEDTIWNLSFD